MFKAVHSAFLVLTGGIPQKLCERRKKNTTAKKRFCSTSAWQCKNKSPDRVTRPLMGSVPQEDALLAGGFNPSEKYKSTWKSSPNRGPPQIEVKIKKMWNHHLEFNNMGVGWCHPLFNVNNYNWFKVEPNWLKDTQGTPWDLLKTPELLSWNFSGSLSRIDTGSCLLRNGIFSAKKIFATLLMPQSMSTYCWWKNSS